RVVFALSRSCPPRDLAPFPTRRSSDLPSSWWLRGWWRWGRGGFPCRPVRVEGPERPGPVQGAPEAGRPCFSRSPVWMRLGPPPRSEEHTSELQSRENLVCRRLLEKKKR